MALNGALDAAPARAGGWPAPVALVLALLVGAAALAVIVSLAGSSRVTVQPNEILTTGLIEANNTPTVARNPVDPDNLVVVNRIDLPRYRAELHWTMDGGRTWDDTALPLPVGKDRPYAPDVSFGSDGSLFVSYVNLTGPGNVPENLWLARSLDGGRSLSDPARVAGDLVFQARVAVGGADDVYLTWLQAETVGLLSLPDPAPVVGTRSVDGGRTFEPPLRVSDPGRERVGAATPVVDSDGDLVVVYEDFGDDERDFQNLAGPAWDEPFSLVATRFQGDGFEEGVEFESDVLPSERFNVFLPVFPSVAPGPDGSLVVAWSDARNGDKDVFVRRSSDGEGWSDVIRVNGNPAGDATDQYLPEIAVAPHGRIDVLFHDRRQDEDNVTTAAFLATSADDAASFDDFKVSSASFDATLGWRAIPRLEADLGARLGLVSTDDRAYAAWTDTRFGNAATQRQDIAFTRIDFTDYTGRLWLLGGLLVLELAALGSWFYLRRSASPGEPDAKGASGQVS